jgi:hypothetical protein
LKTLSPVPFVTRVFPFFPGSLKRLSISGFLWFCLISGGQFASAQDTVSQNPEDLYHWAYAAAFGTGAYRIGDSDMFVIRFTPKFEVYALPDSEVTVNLNLPVTLGLQTFDIDKIISNPIDETLVTFSFVPGVEFVIPVTTRWILKPYGNAGLGAEIKGAASAWIYYGGLNSLFRSQFGQLGVNLLNGVQWLGYYPNSGLADSLARLATGLEGEYPLGNVAVKGQQLYMKPHVIHYWYFNDLDFRIIQESPVEINQELELAFAVGTKEPISIWFLKLDRIGVGYRKGDSIEGIRLIFASVFE